MMFGTSVFGGAAGLALADAAGVDSISAVAAAFVSIAVLSTPDEGADPDAAAVAAAAS